MDYRGTETQNYTVRHFFEHVYGAIPDNDGREEPSVQDYLLQKAEEMGLDQIKVRVAANVRQAQVRDTMVSCIEHVSLPFLVEMCGGSVELKEANPHSYFGIAVAIINEWEKGNCEVTIGNLGRCVFGPSDKLVIRKDGTERTGTKGAHKKIAVSLWEDLFGSDSDLLQ